MKNINFSGFFLIALVLISCHFCSVSALSSSLNDEWKEILTIGDEKDLTIGAELTLSIEPERYYVNPGDEIILSGLLKGIFGPLTGSEILFSRNNSSNESTLLHCIIDETGVCYTPDLLTDTGYYTYQAIYYPDNNNDLKSLKSQKLEICCRQFEEPYNEIINWNSNFSNSEELKSSIEADSNISVQLMPGSSNFFPGESVFFTGHVISQGLPVSYAPVYIVPEINGISTLEGIITLQTNANGSINASYHLTGPDPISFSMYYQERHENKKHQSVPDMLFPLWLGINPPVRVVHSFENLEAYIDSETVESLQNITIYGWYCEKDGTSGSLSVLDLVWYNFGEKIWDKYQNSSKILTNADGLFECMVPAPKTPGMYLLAVKRSGNSTIPDLFSNILPLSVISINEEQEEEVIPPKLSAGQLFISADPILVKFPEEIEISIVPLSFDDFKSDNWFLFLYYSDNGIDWYQFQEMELTYPSEKINTLFIPEKPGYLYFRASLSDKTGVFVNSQTIVVPVLK